MVINTHCRDEFPGCLASFSDRQSNRAGGWGTCLARNSNMEDQKLLGEVAIVTGGGSGIGWAACKAFARAGARLVVSDIDEEAGTRAIKRLKGCGRDAIFVPADVSKAADVEHLIDAAVSAYGCLDIAFN